LFKGNNREASFDFQRAAVEHRVKNPA